MDRKKREEIWVIHGREYESRYEIHVFKDKELALDYINQLCECLAEDYDINIDWYEEDKADVTLYDPEMDRTTLLYKFYKDELL